MDDDLLNRAAEYIRLARRAVAFTGAGISVESGIPPFRGPGGLWTIYDPACLDITYFYADPAKAWVVIKEIFYDYFGQARPNAAHYALAEMEARRRLALVITQNIDNLHQQAGSQNVIEYHGASRRLVCLECERIHPYQADLFASMPPCCYHCGGILRPDFVFFGESIPLMAQQLSLQETEQADLWLVIGTTGEVQPASWLPFQAKQNGATIIEINIRPSHFTNTITDLFLQGKATEMTPALAKRVLPDLSKAEE